MKREETPDPAIPKVTLQMLEETHLVLYGEIWDAWAFIFPQWKK